MYSEHMKRGIGKMSPVKSVTNVLKSLERENILVNRFSPCSSKKLSPVESNSRQQEPTKACDFKLFLCVKSYFNWDNS